MVVYQYMLGVFENIKTRLKGVLEWAIHPCSYICKIMQKYERLCNVTFRCYSISYNQTTVCRRKQIWQKEGIYMYPYSMRRNWSVKTLARKYQHARSSKNLERNHGRDIGENRDGIFKLLRSPGIDSKESIPPAYVAWRASTTTLFLLGSKPPL
jgi:hypothetical protein